MFAVQILIVNHFVSRVDPLRLSFLQFLVCTVLYAIPMLILEKPTLSAILSAWLPIVYAGILSSGFADTMQIFAQKNCSPTLASLVLCLESVFSAVFGWLLLHQRMSMREIFGAAILFLAIVLAALPKKNPQSDTISI
jgi:drug/metabolite transporter (DMT)-like permease